MDDQMPPGFEAGLTQATPPPPPPSSDQMPQGFEAGLSQTTPQTPPAPTPQQPGLLERGANAIASLPGMQIASGAVKGAEKTAAGLIELGNKYIIAPHDPGATATTQKASDIAKGASDWLRKNTETHGWEKVGDIGETVAELLSGGALGEIGKVPDAIKASEYFSKAAETAKFMEGNSAAARVIRAGLQASRGAARGASEQGAQTFVKTGGDVDATKHSATVGGIVGGVVSGGAQLYQEGKQALAELANEIAPGTIKIGKTDFPLLASENPDATLRAKLSAKASGQPQVLEARQALVPQEVANMNENAIRTSLGRSNAAARPPIAGPTGDSAIPAATPREAVEAQLRGHQAMTVDDSFANLDPAEQQAIQQKTGELQQQLNGMPNPAADRAALEQQYRGYSDAMKSDSFDRLDPSIQKSISGKADALKQQLDAMPETPALSSQQQQLRDYQALKDDPSFGQRSPEFQKKITDNISDLTQQLEEGNAWQPHDIEAAVAAGRATPQVAGEVLRAEHKPVYEAIDKANGGALSKLQQNDVDLRTALKNVSSVEEIEKIRTAIKANDAQIDLMFEGPNAIIPKAVRQQARQGWKDGSAMLDVGDALEKYAYNGITPAESAAKGNTLTRLFKGSDVLNKRLQALADDRPELGYLLGPNGITNLKQMGKLLETPESAYQSSGLLGALSKAFRADRNHSKSLASVAAFGPTHALSIAGARGAASTLEGTANYVTERLATDSDFNKMFSYAVNNKVNRAIAIPLLMRKLTGTALTLDDKGQNQ